LKTQEPRAKSQEPGTSHRLPTTERRTPIFPPLLLSRPVINNSPSTKKHIFAFYQKKYNT